LQPKRTSKRTQQLDDAKASYIASFPSADFDKGRKGRNEIEEVAETAEVTTSAPTTSTT